MVDPSAGTTKLVPKTADMTNPAWSPDGTVLAASSLDDQGFDDLYTMKPDGSERRLVLENAHSPSWSPDGKQLVVVREGTAEGVADGNELAIVDADGSGVRTLDLGPALFAAPEWSSDGKSIAFVEGMMIRFVSPAGEAVSKPVEAAWAVGLSWSPDSTRLAFDRLQETKNGDRSVAVVLDVATGRETVLTGEQHGRAHSPTWSPEGDQIAFLSQNEGATSTVTTPHSCGGESLVWHLWVMSPEGTKAHRLVEGEYYGSPSWARALGRGGPAGRHRARAAAASGAARGHRSRATAASGTGTGAPRRCRSRRREAQAREHQAARRPAATDGLIAVRGSDALYLTNPDSGSTRKIPDTSDMVAPAWSPDAKLLAVERVGKGESSIWTIRPDGTDPQLVLPNASLPSWSPAGDRIYAVRNECTTPCEPEDEAANVLFSVRPDGKDVRRVEAGEDVDREFAWAPDGDAIGFFADENASDPGTFDSSAATWSPDGFWVAFVGSVGPFDDETATAPPPYGLWVVSAEGGTPRLLVKGASGRPSWAR